MPDRPSHAALARAELYDTTLRDGSQAEGISFSVEDKLSIAQKLDELGIDYIEGGWPGSNPKDAEFFERAKKLKLKHAQIAAFSMTRRAGVAVEKDENIQALLDAETPVVTFVGKSWDLHVRKVLETSLEENLGMIADSIAYMKSKGKKVVYDAEHFFDGYKANPAYAMQTIKAAAKAGADCIVLCETNGGALPQEVTEIVAKARQELPNAKLGIHAHNDSDLAVANSLAAVSGGATQVQGTINGIGERCGNANLVSIIANLRLKMGVDCLSDAQLRKLKEVSAYVSERANKAPNPYQPFVGDSAFSHKGGMHASAVAKEESSYQHINPELVGNRKHITVSELSGRSNVLSKAKELGIDLSESKDVAKRVVDTVKEMESRGFAFEGAEASFELLLRRELPGYKRPFELVDFMVVVERGRRAASPKDESLAEAMVKVQVDGVVKHTAADGDGPVNALDGALRSGLVDFYPNLRKVALTDYKVRIVDEASGTGAAVRVLIDSTDGTHRWSTVGCSTNIIDASWMALADSVEYFLLKYGR
jgi:2-isopropylmalate synthase